MSPRAGAGGTIRRPYAAHEVRTHRGMTAPGAYRVPMDAETALRISSESSGSSTALARIIAPTKVARAKRAFLRFAALDLPGSFSVRNSISRRGWRAVVCAQSNPSPAAEPLAARLAPARSGAIAVAYTAGFPSRATSIARREGRSRIAAFTEEGLGAGSGLSSPLSNSHKARSRQGARLRHACSRTFTHCIRFLGSALPHGLLVTTSRIPCGLMLHF
jgi:hypothetical protein